MKKEVKQKEVMTTENERWDEFVYRLGGKKGCNFRDKPNSKDNDCIWDCSGRTDRPFANAILKKMGNIDIEKTLEYFSNNGGHCDCEILFNIDAPYRTKLDEENEQDSDRD